MIELKKRVKNIIEQTVQLSFDEITNLDYDEEIQHVESITKSKLVFSKAMDPRITGRGNPYLARKRFQTIEEVNEGLARIK